MTLLWYTLYALRHLTALVLFWGILIAGRDPAFYDGHIDPILVATASFLLGWIGHGGYRFAIWLWNSGTGDVSDARLSTSVVLVLLATGLCLVLLVPSGARAAECVRWTSVWRHGNCDVSEGFFGSCRRGHWRRVCMRWADYDDRYDRYRYRGSRVYGYERRDEESWVERAECRPEWRRSVTGSVHISVEKAQLAAQESWAREMETRYGTRWSDIKSAARMTKECIEKVPNGAIQGAEASLLGVRHHVCTIDAIPCRPARAPVYEEDIAKRAAEKREEMIRERDPRRP